MTKSSKYVLVAVILIAILAVGGFFGFRLLQDRRQEDSTGMTATGDVPQTIEDPDVESNSFATEPESEGAQATNPTVDNSDLKESLRTPKAMQKVVDANRKDLNNSEVLSQLAPSYPSDLIPIYKAKTAADSSDIITVNGKPGWTATYGSDASVDNITNFYAELLGQQDGYKNEKSGNASTITAIVDNCSIEINVSPNNREQTGLEDTTNVNIFIERN